MAGEWVSTWVTKEQADSIVNNQLGVILQDRKEDGKKLVWASNRNGKTEGNTNVFIADWVN